MTPATPAQLQRLRALRADPIVNAAAIRDLARAMAAEDDRTADLREGDGEPPRHQGRGVGFGRFALDDDPADRRPAKKRNGRKPASQEPEE